MIVIIPIGLNIDFTLASEDYDVVIFDDVLKALEEDATEQVKTYYAKWKNDQIVWS